MLTRPESNSVVKAGDVADRRAVQNIAQYYSLISLECSLFRVRCLPLPSLSPPNTKPSHLPLCEGLCGCGAVSLWCGEYCLIAAGGVIPVHLLAWYEKAWVSSPRCRSTVTTMLPHIPWYIPRGSAKDFCDKAINRT